MQPKLLYSIMCDAVARGPEGKMTLYGIFDRIVAREIPTAHASFTIVTAWQSGDREYKMQIRILDPHGKQISKSPEMPFKLRGEFAKSEIVAVFNNMMFEKSGTYLVQVFLHSEIKMEYPFFVIQTKSPKEAWGQRARR